ncbi:hypothetical protein [Neotabrizicola sp. VNH66]|uniref:hypothetical protein n=1 Tax=Neotabrizicola sp. VNH66 TaxID=3400918 RepID=UPI003BFFA7CA
MLSFSPDTPIGPERFYREMSPQLAARLRQMWSARGHDLDRIWAQVIRALPGFRPLPAAPPGPDSRAHDGLCLFDQGLIWLSALHRAAASGGEVQELDLSAEQLRAGAVLTGRMVETMAAIRQLILSGLTLPALQLARSVSEDVDMVLALLLRRRLAGQFLDCRTADEANDFWRRHIAGGRAFRVVAEKLYAIGLDHSDSSEYGRWRREVLTLLGSAIHSSPLGPPGAGAAGWPADPVARDCLQFVTHRLHELCAWAHLLDIGLNRDLARIAAAHAGTAQAGATQAEAGLLVYAATSRDILLDQLRWTVAGSGQGPAG